MIRDRINVFLVDKNPKDVDLIKGYLSQIDELEIKLEVAETLGDDLSFIPNFLPDVILFDFSLLAGHSMESIKKIGQQFRGKAVILLTSLDDENLAMETLNVGVQDYIVKGEMNPGKLCSCICRSMQRIHYQSKISQHDNKIELILESFNDGYWEWNIEKNVLNVSPQFWQMLAMDLKQIQNSQTFWHNLLSKNDQEASGKILEEHIRSKGNIPYIQEIEIKLRDGTSRWILRRGKVVEWAPDGKAINMVGTHSDITKLKSTEAELMQAQKLEAIGQVSSGLAHDLNNKLTVVVLGAHGIVRKVNDKKMVKEFSNTILKTCEQAKRLLLQMMAFSKKQDLKPEILDLDKVLINFKYILESILSSRFKINFESCKEFKYIKIDPVQLDQILLNLSFNAREAMGDGGKLYFKTETEVIKNGDVDEIHNLKPGKYAVISITDTGTGIKKDDLEHIYEPFFTTKGVGKGTGLGLAMVLGIANQNGGTIIVNSELGVGTTFKIYLPFIETGDSLEKVCIPIEKLSKRGILLVENDPILMIAAQKMLVDWGHDVTIFTSSKDALKFWRQESPKIDILISTEDLEDTSRVELSKLCKMANPRLKVILTSSIDNNEFKKIDIEKVKNLSKPYSANKLFKAIDEID